MSDFDRELRSCLAHARKTTGMIAAPTQAQARALAAAEQLRQQAEMPKRSVIGRILGGFMA